MSLPDILRDIDLKAVDGVRKIENTASEAPIVEKVTMRPHSMPLVSLFLNKKIEIKIVVTLRIPFSLLTLSFYYDRHLVCHPLHQFSLHKLRATLGRLYRVCGDTVLDYEGKAQWGG